MVRLSHDTEMMSWCSTRFSFNKAQEKKNVSVGTELRDGLHACHPVCTSGNAGDLYSSQAQKVPADGDEKDPARATHPKTTALILNRFFRRHDRAR
jgi:hypothetical protein